MGDFFFFLHVDEPKSPLDLAPDEEVPPQHLLFAQRFVLVHRLNPVTVRRFDVVLPQVHLTSGHIQLARGRPVNAGEDFDHRGLPGAVVADEAHDFIATYL